jgi:pimeloyl-ACP methyl ester carboxylesterase
MPKVEVNDIEMYYEVHGEGPPLVMLHSFSSSSFKWKPFISEYKKHFKLIIPDMRGHGQSTNPTNKFTHRQSAHDIYALLDHLEIERFKAMGFSSGGMTLIHMATQQPERINSMVLMAATPHFPKEAREMQAHALDKEWEEAWARQNHLHKDGEKQTRLLVQQFYDFKDSYDDMNFTPPYLSTIKAKTLIVHGDRDMFFPVEIPIILYKSIPDSYLWIVPNTGHGPLVEHVERVKQVVLDFLTGKWET